MRIIGIDPGIRGGCAIVDIIDGAAPQLLDAIDIPAIGVGAKERVDAIALRGWITRHAPQHALIERAQAMPKQGASSGFKYGRAVVSIEPRSRVVKSRSRSSSRRRGRSFTSCTAERRKRADNARSCSSRTRTICSLEKWITAGLRRR
jgi:hypothetical protein